MSHRARVAAVYLLGFFVDLINMFIANVAYPGIAREFQAPVSALAWVSTGYILGLTLVIPLSRWLAERFGARRVFILSLTIFMLASLGAGIAGSLTALTGWRIVQGLGGGLLIPLGQTMTYALYRSHERARLSAVIMLVGLLAPALSPAIGGIIVDSFSWRWVFIASLPLALLAWMLALCWLPETPREPTGKLDLKGFVLLNSGLTLVLCGLTRLGDNREWLSGSALLLAGAGLMMMFVRASQKNPNPLLDLSLIKDPLLRVSMLIYQCIPGVFTGVSLIAMLYLQNVHHFSATQSGGLMVPWSLASFAAISFTGKMFNRIGPRALFIPGCLIQGAGIGLLALLSVFPAQPWLAVTAFTLMGAGSSLCSSTAQSAAFLHIGTQRLADASALWNINRQLSFCLGVTLVSVLLNMLQIYLPQSAFRLAFIFASASVIVPVMLCLGLPGRDIVQERHQQELQKERR
ncbi:major facilitator superfamily protein [Rahnella aquatilis CIP 78.65 = ATCC 33071]|uniref:Arabinose efflux permease family protein n=1 Tax=Rahnella aquatilis (strain ATCC 33071 / DSM 4594 / JCM 1683 / NBRC 105701 / NCIMB 13365 / CIP 78.65) TaxID=745277 RepID=H2J1D5_RAHAC|nr:MFS transporter [Rahnella aquatilis]AEX54382.1 arabinose efflux permease family protein [Rahnella aquatilis CIP 78.65 = ATCC 33071]KFC99725.1 major facilitator superfamily protein [Rahnella aquatilis CIP 78.65 = ATCC 33071]